MACEKQTTIDSFFGDRLQIEQSKNGYRAGMDAVLLASAAAALAKTSICELGCGVGVAILGAISMSGAKLQSAAGIDIDISATSLFKANIARNSLEVPINGVNLDGLKPIPEFDGKFELVISNPPFFDDESSIRGPNEARKSAYIIGAPLEIWVKSMLRLASAKGKILIIHRADRLDDIFAALKNRAGDIRIFPIRPNCSAPANRIIICATKANRAPTQIFAGLDIHPLEKGSRFIEDAATIFRGENLQIWDCLK